MGFNKVFLLGNLGSEVNVRHLPDGRPVANVNIATSETWRDQEGNRHKHTEWHRLNFFGRQAEVAAEYMRKGSQVFIEGQLRTRSWQDASGNDRQTTEVRVINFQMLSRRDAAETSGDSPRRPPPDSAGQASQAGQAKGSDAPKGREGEDPFNGVEEDIPW